MYLVPRAGYFFLNGMLNLNRIESATQIAWLFWDSGADYNRPHFINHATHERKYINL